MCVWLGGMSCVHVIQFEQNDFFFSFAITILYLLLFVIIVYVAVLVSDSFEQSDELTCSTSYCVRYLTHFIGREAER